MTTTTPQIEALSQMQELAIRARAILVSDAGESMSIEHWDDIEDKLAQLQSALGHAYEHEAENDD
jgi:hypothetical protein